MRKTKSRQFTEGGDPIPTMAELRQISIACDRWLAKRGEHVGDMRTNIQRACKLNQAERTAQ